MKKYHYSVGFMNYCSHDPGCAIIRTDGKEIDLAYAEEGFLSRKKKSYQFPIRSLNYCLDFFKITLSDVDILMLDYMDHKRNFRTSDNYRLLAGDFIRSKLDIDPKKIKFVKSHHYSHALTAFWPSGLNESAVMIVDGLGSEQQTHSIYKASSKGIVKLLFEQKGVGIGALYSLITNKLGFGAGEEGKTMGLAPYGRLHKNIDKKLPSLRGKLDSGTVDYSNQMYRHPSAKLKLDLKKLKNKKDVYSPYFSRLAYNLQKEAERSLLHLAKYSLKVSKSNNLCFAGGVALNCVANNKIQEIPSIKNFFIQPASGDSGIPIGLAIAGLEEIGFNLGKLFNKKNRLKLRSRYSNDKAPLQYDNKKIISKIITHNKIITHHFCPKQLAKDISDGKIVSLCSSGIEFGPRALGNRSFLADARNMKMKEVMNKKIKHREGYRPFAPIVLEEKFREYFISPINNHPYMLQAPRVKNKTILKAPAICHVDKTARVQTLEKNQGKAREILENYYKLTNIPILINTSFNDNNEPIVFTQIDALCSFIRTNADILILEDKVIYRSEIKNINKLKNYSEKCREDFRKKYFIKSIIKNTSITKKTASIELDQFIKRNSLMSNFFREDRLYIKLINFLFNRNTNLILFIDKYHFNFLKTFCYTNSINFKLLIPKYKIVQDNYESIKFIKNNSEFMLYNLSSYFYNDYTSQRLLKMKIKSFYNLSDKLLENEKYIIKTKSNQMNVIGKLVDSYEHNLDLTIDDFMSTIK